MRKYVLLSTALCLAFAFTSCGTKEDAYKKAYEKAKAQEEQQNQQKPVQDEAPVVTPLAEKPADQTTVTNVNNANVRSESVTVVSGKGLQAYSVVVGSFSLKAVPYRAVMPSAAASSIRRATLGCCLRNNVSNQIDTLGRILSIDYGKRRTGLAVTDPLQIIANGLATVETRNLMDFLKKYLAQESVEKIVIGKPIQPNGTPSENLARVEAFVKRWQKEMPSVPIVYYDERFTSVLAHRAIIEGGVKKKTRRENKGLVDEVSATIILQDFMNSQRRI